MSKGTILVVDDEATVRQFVEAVLQREGYTVLEASNGREALDIFRIRQEEIALVLLDLGMPEMSGYADTLSHLHWSAHGDFYVFDRTCSWFVAALTERIHRGDEAGNYKLLVSRSDA